VQALRVKRVLGRVPLPRLLTLSRAHALVYDVAEVVWVEQVLGRVPPPRLLVYEALSS
jgi:hypothetical protein